MSNRSVSYAFLSYCEKHGSGLHSEERSGKTATVRQRARPCCLKGTARLGSWDIPSKPGLLALGMRIEGEGMRRLEPASQILGRGNWTQPGPGGGEAGVFLQRRWLHRDTTPIGWFIACTGSPGYPSHRSSGWDYSWEWALGMPKARGRPS